MHKIKLAFRKAESSHSKPIYPGIYLVGFLSVSCHLGLYEDSDSELSLYKHFRKQFLSKSE